jgi:hypothetical protein
MLVFSDGARGVSEESQQIGYGANVATAPGMRSTDDMGLHWAANRLGSFPQGVPGRTCLRRTTDREE